MKWRHWAILIVLVLLNYIIFSQAFTILAAQRGPQPRPTRTPQPTFASTEAKAIAWIVLPTSTIVPSRTPPNPAVMTAQVIAAALTHTAERHAASQNPGPESTQAPADTALPAAPSPTESPPTEPLPTATLPVATPPPAADAVLHTIKSGETLSEIAIQYGVTVKAIVQANNLENASHIVTGQKLIIPSTGQSPPAASPQPEASSAPQPTSPPQPTATRKPTPKPTKKPPPPPPTATRAAASAQFTAEIIWDPLVAPNCSGPAIAKQSVIKDAAGNPVNGTRIEVDCYGNVWVSHASGTPGEYDPGHYDFAFGQHTPQNWTCTARVLDVNGQPVTSSEAASIQFDTNDCNPHGPGHQVAIVNWTKHW